MKIGVMIAFDGEMGELSGHGEVKTLAGVRYVTAKFGGNDAVIALSGIGKENAAACTQLLITAFGCERILNIGLAGNASSLPIGGAVVVDRAVYHDMPMPYVAEDYPFLTEFIPDPVMTQLAESILAEEGVPFLRGGLATGDVFVDDAALKQSIIDRTGCSAIEMEGGAIAHICRKNDVPFCIVKVISDSASDGANDEFKQTLSVAGYISMSTSFIRRFCCTL